MRPSSPRRLLLVGLAALWAGGGCGDEPTGPALPELEIVVASGDDQFAPLGAELPTPLHAVVQVASSGSPRDDVPVRWIVEEGSAELVGTGVGVTDSTGSAYVRVRMGQSAGEVTVRVTASEQESATATFSAFAVAEPVLDALSVTEARAGDTIALSGENFIPTPQENVVRFSGVRGRVVAASSGELRVQVPPCLPTRSVQVRVILGSLSSQARTLAVTDAGVETLLGVGGVEDVSEETECVRLPGGGARYLAVLQSSSRVGAARHAYSLVGLAEGGSLRAEAGRPSVRSVPVFPPASEDAPRWASPQEGWDGVLRRREADLLRRRRPARVEEPLKGASRVAEVPSVGDVRSFRVLNGDGGFDHVTAVARWVGKRAVLYVDETAPDGGLDTGDLESFGHRFDDVIHPTVADAFGSESDLDANERVVILFTPTVNRLTERGADGFVGGFFYGLDLLEGREGSNEGEIFYSLVPDPEGTFSDPRSKELVLSVTPAVLAHEFQHMVHFNQRHLVLEAESAEALWLQEGLAQMAEELVARAYETAGDQASRDLFRSGNRVRARRYLSDPPEVSLLVTTGQGSLAERGAGWLHTLYLWDQDPDALARLTRSTRTGVENVTSVVGKSWEGTLADWWAALYLDGLGSPAPPFQYDNVHLRLLLGDGNGYPLQPEELGAGSFQREGSLWSSAAAYYIFEPATGGSLTLGLGGDGGAAAAPSAKLSLRLIRIR